jgi:hypothetical protein
MVGGERMVQRLHRQSAQVNASMAAHKQQTVNDTRENNQASN